MGYSIAMAWLLFLIILAVMFINYRLSGQWMFMQALQEEEG
jgi:ABC-type sugar transport system permease subunit